MTLRSQTSAGAKASSRRQPTGHVITLVVSISVLAVALPVALLAGVPDVGRSAAWPITWGITVWGGFRLSILWVSGSPRLFDYFFWLYTYIFMGIAPTVQMRSNQISTTTPGMDPALDLPTALLVLVGIVSYELGRFLWRMSHSSTGRDALSSALTSVNWMRALLLAFFGLLLSAYFLVKIGPGAALGSRQAAALARAAAWPEPSIRATVYALAVYPMLVAIGSLGQIRSRVDRGGKVLIGCGIIGASVVLLSIVNPISSARYTFGTVAFALAVFAGAVKTRPRARATMGATIVAFLFVFPVADAFRTTQTRASRTGFFGEYMANPDYDSFWQVANSLSYLLDGLVQPFQQLLGSLLFWVPRSIWPGKPTDTGILLAQYRGYTFDNLSAPMWAEMIVNGGIVLLVLGFLVFGPVLARMDHKLLPAYAAGGWWAIIGAIFPVYMTILLRGSLLQATGSLTVALACLLWVRQRPGNDERVVTR